MFECLGERRRQACSGSELEIAAAWHQDGGEGAPECFVRGLGKCLERVRKRERLAEQRGDPKERSLLRDPLLVLAKQLGHPHRESDFAGDGLGQRDLLVVPGSGAVAVERQHSDQLVENDNRNCENRARAQAQQSVASCERRILEGRLRLDILDDHGLSTLDGEVRDGQAPSDADRFQAGPLPLRGRNLAVRAEPDQTAVHRQREARFLDGHAQQLVDVQRGTNARGDPRDETLALERFGQTGGRAGAVERERRIARDAL